MSEKSDSKVAADAAEVALVTTGAIVGGAAGATLGVLSVLANKMFVPLERFRRARQVRFLERVSHFLEANDPEGAAQFVADHSADEYFADALDRGYEKMRRAFDPLAEECICLLVADHVRSGAVTDRRFVRTGSLLEVSDKAMLTTLNSLSESYLSATASAGGTGTLGIVFFSRGVPNERGPFFFIVIYDERTVIGMSNDREAPPNFERVLLQLESHGFGETLRGFGHSPPEGRKAGGPSSLLMFGPADNVGIVSLHWCLAPVRVPPTTT